MNSITYGITEEIYALGENRRVSYGIAAYADAEVDSTATILTIVNDITGDRSKLIQLVEMCNRLELSPVHLIDVVENFLAE